MTTYNYVHLLDLKFISIKGEDRKEFLQDMITNDVNKCIEDNPIYSCFLSLRYLSFYLFLCFIMVLYV